MSDRGKAQSHDYMRHLLDQIEGKSEPVGSEWISWFVMGALFLAVALFATLWR